MPLGESCAPVALDRFKRPSAACSFAFSASSKGAKEPSTLNRERLPRSTENHVLVHPDRLWDVPTFHSNCPWGTCQIQKTEGEKDAWQARTAPGALPNTPLRAKLLSKGFTRSGTAKSVCKGFLELLQHGRLSPPDSQHQGRKEGTNEPVDRGSHLQQLTPPSSSARPVSLV